MTLTYKNSMEYSEIENLMNALLASNLHFLDKLDFANGFMSCDIPKEYIENLI